MEFASVCCDWMSGRHEYAEPVEARDSGRILKIKATGEIEYEAQQWEQIKCASSDTSIRVRCDGHTLKFMGNIGRFQQADNEQGHTVLECVEKWAEILRGLGYNVAGFGSRFQRKVGAGYGEAAINVAKRVGMASVLECGTYLTRIDLAGNFQVSDYAALASAMMVRRIGQKLPTAGKYGPMWGYDSKRSNWWKAKLYDKTAELQGKRRSLGGATRARFEVQLGSEFLKREGLDAVAKWKDTEMAQIIYGRFAEPVFKDSLSVQEWGDLPPKLEHWATLWREGRDLRTKMSIASYYRVRSKLMEFGIDIGTPCNVMALTRHCRIVEVAPVSALRILEAA